MSTVIRPSGPLPPRVYWARRLVLVSVLALVTLLLWWLVSGPGDANETDTSAGGQSPSTTSKEPKPTSKPVKQKPTSEPAQHKPTARPKQEPKPEKPTSSPLAQPTGDCDPTGVDMTIDVSDVKAGRSNTATFVLTSTDTPACTLSVTPSNLVVKVSSGNDTVWSSDDCPDALLAKQIVVRTDPPSVYQFTWNGRRSSEGCQVDERLPEPGGYWVEAALIGGEPHKAYFDVM